MVDNIDKKYIKIVLIGEAGTGKTSLINVYFDINFESFTLSTLSPESCSKELKINDVNYLINIWDTAGQERFRSMTKIFLKGAKIVIIVYDVTRRRSFEEVKYWVKSVEELLGKDITFGLIGNKFDLIDEQEVSKEEGNKLAKEIGAFFSETSAKENPKGFQEYITKIVEFFLEKKGFIGKKGKNFSLTSKNKNKRKICCK